MRTLSEPNPTLARRRLAVRLRQARERNGRSLIDLAEQLDVSLPQASRLDTGARGYKPEQIESLGDWYGLGTTERSLLVTLAAESRRRVWWQQVDLPDSYRTLIGLEKGASVINEYCVSVLPGLVQLPDYARAVAGSAFEVTSADVQQAVDVRMRRQKEMFDDPSPPRLWIIIDEAALARPAGDRSTMAAQLEHLLALAGQPRVTVQVIGFEAGIHVGALTLHFILLEMDDGLPDVIYTDGGLLPSDTDDADDVAGYRRRWNLLRAIALDERASMERIGNYLEGLRGNVGAPA